MQIISSKGVCILDFTFSWNYKLPDFWEEFSGHPFCAALVFWDIKGENGKKSDFISNKKMTVHNYS